MSFWKKICDQESFVIQLSWVVKRTHLSNMRWSASPGSTNSKCDFKQFWIWKIKHRQVVWTQWIDKSQNWNYLYTYMQRGKKIEWYTCLQPSTSGVNGTDWSALEWFARRTIKESKGARRLAGGWQQVAERETTPGLLYIRCELLRTVWILVRLMAPKKVVEGCGGLRPRGRTRRSRTNGSSGGSPRPSPSPSSTSSPRPPVRFYPQD